VDPVSAPQSQKLSVRRSERRTQFRDLFVMAPAELGDLTGERPHDARCLGSLLTSIIGHDPRTSRGVGAEALDPVPE
jgi:hypothetical protein